MAEAYLPLLRMSIGLQQEPNANEVRPMEPERREWLKEAMSNMLKSPVEEMKLALKNVREGETEDDKVAALESLVGFVEQIDFARDLHKIGGLTLVIELLDSDSAKIRAAAAQVLGTAVHNNPEPQKWAYDLGALEALCRIVGRERATIKELSKAFYAISSLIRNNDLATVKYVKEMKGLALIVAVLSPRKIGDDEMLLVRKRAAFLLMYLVRRAPAIVPATAAACVPALSMSLKKHAADPDFRENALLILQIYANNEALKLNDTAKNDACGAVTEALATIDEDDSDSKTVCMEILSHWKL